MRWLKRLFYKKKTLAEVNEWLEEKQRQHEQDFHSHTSTLKKEFPAFVRNTKHALNLLEQAEPPNPNIPHQEKHILEGNKSQFITTTTRFLDRLYAPENSADIKELDTHFSEYAKQTSKATAILSQFIREDVQKIRNRFALLEAKLNTLKQLEAKQEDLTNLASLLKNVRDAEHKKREAEREHTKLTHQLNTLTEKHERLKKEKEALTKREEYHKVKDDILAAAKERQDAEHAITTIFQPLTSAIKKHAHATENEKLRAYGENPLNALIHDYSLGILKHTDELIGALTRGELEPNQDKREKALASLKEFSKEKLGGMIHRYANAKKRETDVHHDIAQRPVMQEYEQYAKELKTLNEEIGTVRKALDDIDIPDSNEHLFAVQQALDKHNIALQQKTT